MGNQKKNKSKKVGKRIAIIAGICIGAVLLLALAIYLVGYFIYDNMYTGPIDTSVNTDLAYLREILERDGEYTGSDFTPEQVAEVMSGILLEKEEEMLSEYKDYSGINELLSNDVNADLSAFLGDFTEEELDYCRKLYIYDIGYILRDREYIETNAPEISSGDETTTSPESETTPPETASSESGTETEPETEPKTEAPPETTAPPKENVVVTEDDIYNVLLLGVDGSTYNGRTDTIILVSINKATKRIILTSFMRDLQVYDPSFGICKINSIYARRGDIPTSVGRLAVVLDQSFGMKVDNFAVVNFSVFDKVLNILGGVEVPMYYCEWHYMRRFTYGENKIADISDQFKGGNEYGTVNVYLNANQALVYARMRKNVIDPVTGNYMRSDDRYRNERQRAVIDGLFSKIKTLSFTQICQIVQELMQNVQTDLTYNEFLSKMLTYMDYNKYTIEGFQAPLEGRWYYGSHNGTSYVVSRDNAEIGTKWREFVYR